MGFRPEPTIYKLNFDATELAGLHIRAACCTMAEFNEMLRMTEEPDTKKVADSNERIAQLFLSYLKEWDLEDPKTGAPVPMTMEGMNSLEQPLIGKIISAWQMAIMTVPVPLNSPSTNGRSSEEASLGLGNPSTSQPSWPAQS